MSNADLLKKTDEELISLIDPIKKEDFVRFIKELNRREYLVRFAKAHSFDDFRHRPGTEKDYGYGFIVDEKAVPYFHPNRSFHDEIIWLNENLYYNPQATFEDKLINSAIVKFYGPSNTVKIAVRNSGADFVVYEKLIKDKQYQLLLCQNLQDAAAAKEKIYGTTELRTSLQVAARNYARSIGGTPIDRKLGTTAKELSERSTRTSDILYWFTYMGPKFVEFYKTAPDMKQSFEFLNGTRGIGNYYGYHFSCNLARMPQVGTLIREGAPGKIDEDDNFVVPGVGAMDTVNYFYEKLGHSISPEVGRRLINAIRHDQSKFFDLKDSDESNLHMKEVSELGYFTNFGCEISCCQFGVYRRMRDSKKLALKRAAAPISKEEIAPRVKSLDEEFASLEEDCDVLSLQEAVKPSAVKAADAAEPLPKPEPKKRKVAAASSPKRTIIAVESPPAKKKVEPPSGGDKVDKIVKIIDTLSGAADHKTIARLAEVQHPGLYKQEGNWKETWAILQDLVKSGALEKAGTHYRRKDV
jgi:hypothetical protein